MFDYQMKHMIAAGFLTVSLVACNADPKETAADVTADVSLEDTQAPDVTVIVARPHANIYRVDPLTTPATEVVELKHLPADYGILTGDFARVRSCTPDLERGQEVPVDLGGGFVLDVTTCVPEALAQPGDDGTYLHIKAPTAAGEDDAEFSEVMMYHHMQVIHDYFKNVHGLTDRDAPLDAVTNVQAHVSLCDEWAKIANAAFIPKEGLDQLPFGLDFGLTGDAIVFSGTEKRNFSFDAAVIYHEYAHAILGATRLNAVYVDTQGLNNLPGALNEAYADYFAIAITGESSVGNYALNDLGTIAVCGFPLGGGDGNLSRDMRNTRTCPDDLTAEVHADSEIFSSALWEIRQELGATDADRVILTAVLSLNNTSDFQVAADATIDAALDLVGPEAETTVMAAFEARGILGCKRVLPAARVGVRGPPLTVEGNNAFSPNPYPAYTPGYLQASFEVPEGATAVEITVTTAAGAGGAAATLELALKAGTEPIAYTYGLGPGSARNNASRTIALASNKAVLAAAAGETLTPGPWVMSFHNKGESASITAVRIKDLTER